MTEQSAADQLQQIGRWSRQTQEGSRSDLGFQPLPAVWDAVQSDSGNCLGRACPDYAKCFYFKARKQMFGAQLLIVNHALFFSDLALRRQGGSMLPDYKVVIFDEAHTLEDVAADHLGLQVGRGTVEHLLNKLYSPRNGAACSAGSTTRTRFAKLKSRGRPPTASSTVSSTGRFVSRAVPAATPRDPLRTRSVFASQKLCPIIYPKS